MSLYKRFKSLLKNKYPELYKKLEQRKLVVKFIISGGSAAMVNLVSLYIFTDILDIWYLISTSFAFVLAFLVSFSLQKFWTFRDNNKEKIKKQAIIYLGVALINLAINGMMMYVLVDKVGIWYIFSQVITSVFLAISSFFINKLFIFKTSDSSVSEN